MSITYCSVGETPEQRHGRLWATHDATARSMENRWARAQRRVFGKQEDATISRMTGNRGRKLLKRTTVENVSPDHVPAPIIDAAQIFDVQHWTNVQGEINADLYEAVAAQGFARVSNQFGVAFDLESEFAQQFIEGRANQLAGQVTDTTYKAIQQVLSDGLLAGDDIDTLTEAVRGVFAEASASRAATIARTEVVSAFNGSTVLAAQQLPADVVGGQEWVATQDARCRESHSEADGQIVDLEGAFDVGGWQLQYPGDPAGPAEETVNCRCGVVILTADEMADAERSAPIRVTSIGHARLALRLVGPDFDEAQFRSALVEVA